MDLQNNNATRVAGLDERGVSIERDGKQVKFIPWGEDAEARAAAAAASGAADAAGRKAKQAAEKADSAAAAAAEAASAAGEATETAQEAQEAAEQAAASASNAVQKISSEPQTAGKTLTSQSDGVPSGSGWLLTADGSSASTAGAEISATGNAGKASMAAGPQSVTSVVQNQRGTTLVESGINKNGGTVAYHHIDTNTGNRIEARLKGQNADGKLWGGEDAIGQQILAIRKDATSSLEVGSANLYGSSVTSESDYAHFFSAKLLADAPATEAKSKASLILTAVAGKANGETYKWWRTLEIDGFNQKITVSRRAQDGSFEVREIDLWELAGE